MHRPGRAQIELLPPRPPRELPERPKPRKALEPQAFLEAMRHPQTPQTQLRLLARWAKSSLPTSLPRTRPAAQETTGLAHRRLRSSSGSGRLPNPNQLLVMSHLQPQPRLSRRPQLLLLKDSAGTADSMPAGAAAWNNEEQKTQWNPAWSGCERNAKRRNAALDSI